MSIAKHLHEDRIFKGSWRAVVVSPSKVLWDGSEGRASCPDCRTYFSWTDKIPEKCPRCGAFLRG